MSDNGKYLILYEGNIQKLEDDGDVNIVKFKKTILNLSGIATKSIREPKIQETSTLAILRCIWLTKSKNFIVHNCSQTKKTLMDTKIEINKRFGMPVFIPLISLVCSFLLSSSRDKKIYNYRKYIYFFVAFVILVLAEIMVRYSGISWKHTMVYYLFPLLMLPLFYFTLLRKFKHENLY